MKKYSLEEVKTIVAKRFSNNDMDLLFPFLNLQIRLETDATIINELILLKAECYQRIGDLNNALNTLDKFDQTVANLEMKTIYETLKLKISFQEGQWDKAFIASDQIINEYKQQNDNVLWRSSLLYSIKEDLKNAQYYGDMHREKIDVGGFQEANNLLYTLVIPRLMYDEKKGSLIQDMDPVEYAQNIYKSSIINFNTKRNVGSRLKSCCQAMIIASFINYDYGNTFEAYVLSLMTGLCMKHSKLNLSAEGIGEIVKLLHKKYNNIIALIYATCQKDEETFWDFVKNNFTDYEKIYFAYTDALYRFDELVSAYIQLEVENQIDSSSGNTEKKQLEEGLSDKDNMLDPGKKMDDNKDKNKHESGNNPPTPGATIKQF